MQQVAKVKQRHFVHKKLKRKIYIYLGIFFAMLIICIYDILAKYIDPLQTLIGWALGFVLGYGSGIATKVYWHEETELVISKRDVRGIIILILYIALSISRRWLLQYWFHGNLLTAFIFSIVAGSRLGGIVSIRKKIKKVLKAQGISGS